MTRSVATCHVNDTANIAARLMWDRDCGVLPVVNDEGKVTGVITDRDICMAALMQGRALDEVLVNTAMAKHVVAVTAEQEHLEAEQLMRQHQLRRLPVVDGSGRPVGILSLNDLARANVQGVAPTLAAICKPRPDVKKAA